MRLLRQLGRYCCRRALCRTLLPTLALCVVISLTLNLGSMSLRDGYVMEADHSELFDLPPLNNNTDQPSERGSILDQIRRLSHVSSSTHNQTTFETHFSQPHVNTSSMDALERQLLEPLLSPHDYVITGTLTSRKRFLTIGIPTVFRQHAGDNYIKGTIASLLENCSEEDRRRIVIFIFLADLDLAKREAMRNYIRREYPEHLASGLVVIFEVRQEVYPPLEGLKQNFKDEPRRVSWRSKQVCDFAFMFYVARNLSQYYVQIEDDVVAAKNYVPRMETFIQSVKKPWVTLLVSELGFIGKVYESLNLEALSRFFIMFYQEMPVDFLYIHFAKLLTYPDMPLLKPTLFQHMGKYSSLILSKKQKINNLKDKYFDRIKHPEGKQLGDYPKPQKEGSNPPATIYTSLLPYQKNVPMMAYQGKVGEFFWGKTPRKDDHYTVVFKRPQEIEKVVVETGHFFQRNDFIRKGVLEASSSLKEGAKPSMPQCASYHVLREFLDGRIEVDHIRRNVTSPLVCLRIRITEPQEEWVLIHQITVWTGDDLKPTTGTQPEKSLTPGT